jgi:hypothetical protein
VLKILRKIDQKCEQYLEVLVLQLTIVILRIPNFFEPYWYGDEAIYLTVGTGIRQGLRLYSDIIDHKTPLIYYLAAVPSQFHFRLLNLFWMMAATTLFFFVAKKIFANSRKAFAGSFILVLLTTLPWLEGHIPNGELFVIGFVAAGLLLLGKTRLFQKFFANKPREALQFGGQEKLWLILSGSFFGLGVLTKVPGLLDFGAVLLLGWFALAAVALVKTATWREKITALGKFIAKSSWLFLGLLIPIIISVIYFVSQGSGQDYFQYGLLYNFRYSGSWQLDLNNPLLEFFFTLPGKISVLAGLMLLLTLVKKYTLRFKFIAGWFALTLFAALLSNRPYPHYLIQVVPPFSLLLVELWLLIQDMRYKKTMLLTGVGLLVMPMIIIVLLNVRPYSAKEYYLKFYELVSGKITMEEYDHSFSPYVANNYQAAEAIRGLDGERMFIWGTNPMLYALTKTTPTSRFTVSFHIKDFADHANTLRQIKQEKPKIIVVMENEDGEFPGLYQYLDTLYYPNTQYDTMTIYLLQEVR